MRLIHNRSTTNALFVACVCMVFSFAACQSEGGGKVLGGSSGKKAMDKKGVNYTVHTNKGENKAKMGDFVTLNMQYATMNDSVIFSSFDRAKPLSFKFQPTLFKGVLNEGLQAMGAGDSATFLVPADTLYTDKMPGFVKSGDQIKYIISLQKVQSQEEYQAEAKANREVQLNKDEEIIAAYTKAKGITTEKFSSGTHYVTHKAGSGDNPDIRSLLKAKYTLSYIDGTELVEVENTNGKVQDLAMSRQVTGVRQLAHLLKKGSKSTLIIPSIFAYRDRQRGEIPANSVLVYDIEVTGVESTQK